MVAREDNSSGSAHRNPAGGFERLGGFVDEKGRKFHPLKQSRGAPDECAGNDVGTVEEVVVDAYLKFGGPAFQTFDFGVPLVCAASGSLQLSDGFPYAPKVGVVGMRFKTPSIRRRQHLVVDSCWIPDAEHVDTSVGKLFRNPVHGHIALGADKHLTLPS